MPTFEVSVFLKLVFIYFATCSCFWIFGTLGGLIFSLKKMNNTKIGMIIPTFGEKTLLKFLKLTKKTLKKVDSPKTEYDHSPPQKLE